MAGAKSEGVPKVNRASIDEFSLISAFRRRSKDVPVIVNLISGKIG